MKTGYLIAAAGALLVIAGTACSWYLYAYPMGWVLGMLLAAPGGSMVSVGLLSIRDDGY